MPKIYQQLIDKAVITGAITPEQYLQIPWNERENMQYLFSFRMQWVLTRGITFEQYMQILLNYRKITQGVNSMTFEQFLELRWYERSSMSCFFSSDGQQAVAAGIISLEQYLQIPWDERDSLQYLFSSDGRQALAENIITFKQYLKIPVFSFLRDPTDEQRNEILGRLSPHERQAVEDGIITLEQGLYLQIPLLEPNKQSVLLQLRWNDRISMQYLFSPGGRQAVADGLITLEQYLQIPRYDRQDVIVALQDHDTRQRIINGDITIENIIGIDPMHDVAVYSINAIQNTHTTSVHQSVSESATRLLNLYESGINGVCLESTLEKAQPYVSGLSDESTKNRAAKRGFLRIVAPDYNFTDKSSKVTIRKLLAVTFLAIHDDEKRVGSLEDAQMQFVKALYEIQRGYNLSESGVDQGGEDQYVCFAGTFNKLIEKLNGIHPDGRVLYITEETCSLKLPIVVREEAMQYLTTINAEALPTFTLLIARVKKEGVMEFALIT